MDDLDIAIASAEQRLRELDRRRAIAVGELEALRRQREPDPAPAAVEPRASDQQASFTPQRKLALFQSLFKGRGDVYAIRWQKRDRAKSGWAPRCANEWKPGVCGKPQVRCGECANQAFLPVTEAALLAHLQGRQVMGVYPLLCDETCWLVAIDLDGRSWRADVRALREAAHELGLTLAVERSCSGDGAHAWLFFTEPVQAALARALASLLLTAAMAGAPTLAMASYDRLFPSQDSLPREGFGNLIALPLQREARELGNTLFLDEHLEPYADQWSYLASLQRITPSRLRELVVPERSADHVLGLYEPTDDDAPWRPAPPIAKRLSRETLPASISATLAGRLYVRRDGLPPALMDALRRLAAFQNPKFKELEAMRLSTARTPRVISCFEESGRFLAFPRGALEPVRELLEGLHIDFELSDERTDGARIDASFHGELSGTQEQALAAIAAQDCGVLCAPPGAGKTVIACKLIAARARSTLVLVHRKPLLEQWVSRLSEQLGLPAEAIGTIGSGREQITGELDVAMVQSLARRNALDELLSSYGHVVVDECHHVPALTTARVLAAAPARLITGLTATPRRRDGLHPIIAMQCGPVRHTIARDAASGLALRVVRRETPFDPGVLPTDAEIQEIFAALCACEARTELIVGDALSLVAEGRCPLVLTERHEHLQRLAERLRSGPHELITLHGEMRQRERRAALGKLHRGDETLRVVLATGRYIGEGFDYPRLDALLLAMPIAWQGTVVQYAGRLHRERPGKCDVVIYDYVDQEVSVLRRMWAKRARAYKSLGYQLEAGERPRLLDLAAVA